MTLLLVGINHKTAPVEIRELVQITDAASLLDIAGVDGAVVISTCNRAEVIVSAESEDVLEPLVKWMSGRGADEKSLYMLRHTDVVAHLFRVAAGLDSMIVGEPQIAGQVKDAFQSAALDPLLRQLYEQTMRVSKRVRSETGIGEHAVSVPYAAVELAKKIFGAMKNVTVLIVGAGEMAELTAEHLTAHDVRHVFVANRAFDRAQELAARFGGEAMRLDSIEASLAQCDIVIASTGAPHALISADAVARALHARKRRALFLIDLSVPRNIDPEVAKIEGAYLYNIDDLQQVADANRQLRQRKAIDAEDIVAAEVDAFRRKLVAQDVVPTIVELQHRLEELRAAELEKCLRKVGPITPEQREAIEMLTTQMVNKILHYPILQLKEASEEPQERDALRRTIRKIFGLR